MAPLGEETLQTPRLWQCRTNGIRAFARVQPVHYPMNEHQRPTFPPPTGVGE